MTPPVPTQEFPYSPSNGATPPQPPTQTPTSSQPWKWGFREKTGLDLLQIFASLAASLLIPVAVHMLSTQQAKTAEDSQRQELVSKYYDQMSTFLLGEALEPPSETASESEKVQHLRVVSMARARTLSIFRQLDGDGERRGQLLKFLYEAKLIGGQCRLNPKTLQSENCQDSLLPLEGAKLEGLTFDSSIPLTGVNLYRATLTNAKLPGIDLSSAEMDQVNLKGAELSKALLKNAQMEKAILEEANLTDASLPDAHLKSANLKGAKLAGANLKNADLTGANLSGADLRGADLTNAKLDGANLEGAIYNRKSTDQAETKFPTNFDPAPQKMLPGQPPSLG